MLWSFLKHSLSCLKKSKKSVKSSKYTLKLHFSIIGFWIWSSKKYPYGVFTNNNRCCTFCECFFGSECAIPATLCTMYASLRQVRFSASSMLLPVKYASPRQVRFSASSTLLRVKYASLRQVPFSASSTLLCVNVSISGQFGSQGELPLCYLTNVWIFSDTRFQVPVQ